MYCKNCGKPIEEDSKFCKYCGLKIEVEKPKEAPSQRVYHSFSSIKLPKSEIEVEYEKEGFDKISKDSEVLKEYFENKDKMPKVKAKSKKQKIEEIELMTLEQQAAQSKMSYGAIGCLTLLIFIIASIYLGFYYITPNGSEGYGPHTLLWGFIIGLALCIIIFLIDDYYWKPYNTIIETAQNKLRGFVRSADGTPEELVKWRIADIERKMENGDIISDVDFRWHSFRICWGCGKIHTQPPKKYHYLVTRTATWKEGVYRHSRTFKRSTDILICPDCLKRLGSNNGNGDFVKNTAINFNKIPTIARFFKADPERLNRQRK